MSAAVQPVTPELAGALTMYEAGYAVQPCHVVLDRHGKKQITRGSLAPRWETFGQERTSILRAFAGGANAHLIACGPSNLVVADLDIKEQYSGVDSWGDRPQGGFQVRTRTGGVHHYFINNAGTGCATGVLPGVDIRGIGGGVFGPGSLNGAYQVIRSGPLTPWSAVGLDIAVRPARVPAQDYSPFDDLVDPRPGLAAERVPERVRECLHAVTTHARTGWEGFRDTLCLRCAPELGGYLHTGLYDRATAEQWLIDAIRAAGHEPNAQDLQWIQDGLDFGEENPLKVRPPGGQRPLVRGKPAVTSAAGLRLPEEFWRARDVHNCLRTAAHHRACSADAVLGVTLARLSSLIDGTIRVDTGVRAPVALNTYAVLLGDSGDGKTSAADVAGELLPLQYDHDSMANPLGSGQGIADAFGKVDSSDGQWKQCTHKAFFFTDEGSILFSTARQKDSTLLGTLRTAWMGGKFGQRNATAERNRLVRQYSLGIWLGLQPVHAVELFSDTNIRDGTLQRFLWFSTELAPEVSDQRPRNSEISQLPLDLGVVWSQDPVRLPEHLKDLIFARNVAAAQRRLERTAGREHEDLYRVKVACLLALLDNRRDVIEEDWQLAGLVMDTSNAVADSVRQAARERAQQAEEARVARRHRIADADEQHADRKVEQAVLRVVAKVTDRPGIRQGLLLDGLCRDREVGRTAIARALERGLIHAVASVAGRHGETLHLGPGAE